MEISRTLIVKYKPNSEFRKLLADFRDMVNFAIREALRMGKCSIRKLHETCYPYFKQRYSYSTYYYSRAYRIASQIIRSCRRRGREPKVEKLFVRLHKAQFKLEADKLKVSIKPREFAF